jgi:hypothetical protein
MPFRAGSLGEKLWTTRPFAGQVHRKEPDGTSFTARGFVADDGAVVFVALVADADAVAVFPVFAGGFAAAVFPVFAGGFAAAVLLADFAGACFVAPAAPGTTRSCCRT